MKKFFLILAVLSFIFSLFSYLFIDANLFYLKVFYSGFYTEQKVLVSIIYILFIIAFFAVYIILLKKQKEIPFKNFMKSLIPIVIILLLAYPAILSYDIFNYLITSKVIYFYHENPYVIMPIEIINEPTLVFTRATNKLALYGPSWILLTAIPYYLSFGNFLLNLFLLKALVSTFFIGTCYLIYKITKSIKPVVFFALNPLVLIEILVSGHNDIVMMFTALLSIYLLEKRKYFTSIASLFFSVLIKYATLFLLPLYFYLGFQSFKNKNFNWYFIGMWGFISMMVIFLLSPIREEIYPWYAIWFLLFAALCLKNKLIRVLSISLSFGLMLGYIPYMFFGTYFGIVPFLKTLFTFVPPVTVLFTILSRKLWLKR